MRGEDRVSGALFSGRGDVEARIPAKHPLRAMRRVTDAALAALDRAFSALYEGCGRPSIPPERLLARGEVAASSDPLRAAVGLCQSNGRSSTYGAARPHPSGH